MRLIDADECEKYFYDHMTDNAMAGAMNAIDEMPTIEPCMAVASRNVVQNLLPAIKAEIKAISVHGQIDEHTLFVRTGEQVKQIVLDIIDKYSVK